MFRGNPSARTERVSGTLAVSEVLAAPLERHPRDLQDEVRQDGKRTHADLIPARRHMGKRILAI